MLVPLVACVLLSYISPLQGSGGNQDCIVRAGSFSPYVSAQYKRPLPVTGCTSQERAKKGQEIHVVNLVGENTSPDSRVVALTLKPQPDTRDRQLILVLRSHEPVVWKLKGPELNNGTRHLVYMSKGSRCSKQAGRLNVKVKKLGAIPEETKLLVNWVRRTYGALTSFTQATQANIITISVGPDTSALKQCNVAANFDSTSSQVFYLETVSAQTCVAPLNQGYNEKDVHILELFSADSETNNSQIILDIRPKNRGALPSKYIVLILRSHSKVKLMVRTRGLRGSLDIITDQEVDTEGIKIRSLTVRITAEVFNKQGQDLVKWTKDFYGPPVSYTGVQRATKFTLFMNGADGLNLTPTPAITTTRHQISPFDNPDVTRRAIQSVVVMRCHNRGMEVSLRKAAIKVYGITKDHLSLVNQSCEFQSNRTHLYADTRLGACGTKQIRMRFGIRYQNQIIIRRLPQEVAMVTGRERGSGLKAAESLISDDEDYGGGLEDLINRDIADPISVEFHCDYFTGRPEGNRNAPIKTEKPSGHNYSLSIYTDDRFNHPHQLVHAGKNQKLYVQATSGPGADHCLMVRNCWLSSKKSPEEEAETSLVENGCKAQYNLEWHMCPGVRGQSQCFSFRMPTPPPSSTGIDYLHCEVVLRGRENTLDAKCLPQEQYCFTQKIRENRKPDPDYKTVTAGPIYTKLVREQKPSPGFPTPPVHTAPQPPGHHTDSNCRNTQVLMQGLDSGTVIGIAFAAFIIGVLLIAALWFIHTHTAPVKRHRKARGIAEGSGESTPSSSSPISA